MDNIQKFMAADMLSKKVSALQKSLKADAETVLEPGDRKTVSFELDGEKITLGAITRTKPRTAWKVVDEGALTKWIQENHPDKIEMIPAPKEWFVKSLLDQAAANGVAVTDGGEMVPGIESREGTSYASAKPEKDADEKLARLVAGGVIQTAELLMIEGEAA
ncbi:hypothetical protein [Glutamicibacter sp. NPDC127525]|uniref:hypothetical protein n=1 Tax=unclassified Glutamicibacter TaxID=2627139 RepID=UPI00363280FB